MQYQPNILLEEQQKAQEVILLLQEKIETQQQEIEHLKDKNRQVKKEKDQVSSQMYLISASLLSLKKELKRKENEVKDWKDNYYLLKEGEVFSKRWFLVLCLLATYGFFMTISFVPATATYQSVRAFVGTLTVGDYFLVAFFLLMALILLYCLYRKIHIFIFGY